MLRRRPDPHPALVKIHAHLQLLDRFHNAERRLPRARQSSRAVPRPPEATQSAVFGRRCVLWHWLSKIPPGGRNCGTIAKAGTLRLHATDEVPISGIFRSELRRELRPIRKTVRREEPMAKDKTLHDLFHDTLKDIYFAEKKILGALPKMAKAAQSEELKAAFEKHEAETEQQVERLDKVFAEIDESPRGKTCDAIIDIIEEGQEIMKEYKGTPALDAGLLAAAQSVEHYEISRYGTLKTWAAERGLNEAVNLL